MMVEADKDAVRERLLGWRKSLPSGLVRYWSKGAQKMLLERWEYKSAGTVMAYVSTRDEVDTREIIEAILGDGKRLVLPRVAGETLEPRIVQNPGLDLGGGTFAAIAEPVSECCPLIDTEEIDIVIVPGVAFDKYSRRLGRGRGYYDRFLSGLSGRQTVWGLAFDAQLLGVLPHGDVDVPVDGIVTPSGLWIYRRVAWPD